MSKGRTNNPSGRPAQPWDVLQAKKRLRSEYDRTVCAFIGLPIEQINKVAEDQSEMALHRIIAKIVVNLINDPNVGDLESLLGRPLGRPSTEGEVIVRETAELAKEMIDMPDEDRIKLIENRLLELKGKKK